MKKSILSVIAIALVGVFAFTSCNRDKTMTDYLTTEKGWTLSEATTTPYWTLNGSNAQITNLFDGYILDCEKDDIIKFNVDGYVYFDNGKDVCEDYPSNETSLGKWAINEEDMVLDMQIPFFGTEDTEVESCKILNLVKDELKVNFTWTLTEDPAKGVPGTYTFTLTYVPAK